MKATIITTKSEEVEITLPAYRKTAKIFYKVIDENVAIKIKFEDYRGFPEISATVPSIAFDGTFESTEEEFVYAYHLARMKFERDVIRLDNPL